MRSALRAHMVVQKLQWHQARTKHPLGVINNHIRVSRLQDQQHLLEVINPHIEVRSLQDQQQLSSTDNPLVTVIVDSRTDLIQPVVILNPRATADLQVQKFVAIANKS